MWVPSGAVAVVQEGVVVVVEALVEVELREQCMG